MSHRFEAASSGRSKCRGCGQGIAKGELRFGERLPNPFGEGEVTHWFHPLCAAYKRPEPMLETLAAVPDVPGKEALQQAASRSAAAKRLPRIDGAERSPSGQARCRQCREPIERDTWRIRLVLHEEGNFSPGGFVHLKCRRDYFEADDILEQMLHFSRALGADDREALKRALE